MVYLTKNGLWTSDSRGDFRGGALYCFCPRAPKTLVKPLVYCTHRQSVGKLPPEVPCWARSSGPQVAVVISRQRGLMRHARLWPTHVTRLGLASLLHHRRLSPMLLSPRVEFSGPRQSRLPLFCRSSHHVYVSEDVPTCKEITEEGATNTQVRLVYEFFPNFRQK